MMTTARVVSQCLVSFTCTSLGILLIDQRNVCCQALCVLGCFFVQDRLRELSSSVVQGMPGHHLQGNPFRHHYRRCKHTVVKTTRNSENKGLQHHWTTQPTRHHPQCTWWGPQMLWGPGQHPQGCQMSGNGIFLMKITAKSNLSS